MIPAEKIALIKKKIKNGYPIGELKNELMLEGYSAIEIDACFKAHEYDMRSWYLFFGLLFLVTGIWCWLVYDILLLLLCALVLLYLFYKAHKKRGSKATS